MFHVLPCRDFRTLRLAGLLLLLPALANCDSGGTGPENTLIGEAGGDVTLAGGSVKLSIPAGALATEHEFSATQTGSFPPSDLIVTGSTYDIAPLEASFDRLVRLTLSYDPDNLPRGVREQELRLFKAAGGQWDAVLNTSVDTQANTVSGTVSSLGLFGAMGLSVAAVEVSPSHYSLERGQTRSFTAAALDAFGGSLPERTLSWTSSDEGIATVDADGLVTSLGVGTVTIRAEAGGRTSAAGVNTWDCSWQEETPAAECQALIELFNTVNAAEWRDSPTWVPSPYPCEWLGVTCEGGSVSEVAVFLRGPPGSIPFSISQLTNLTRLDLSSNQLSGPIPASLGDLSKLTWLNLRGNQLSGPIPPELQQLSRLTVLDLGKNELSGIIPAGLGSLSDLTELGLGWNELSGSIPSELGSLSKLTILKLIDNQLTGGIPAELGELSELTDLSLSFNELSGQIPPEFGNLSKLVSFGVLRNRMSGPIPAEIGNLVNLNGFYLEENEFSGIIPLGVAELGGRIQARSGGSSKCRFTPPGNTGLSMPDTQEYHAADQNGDGKICGVGIGGV